MVKLDDYNKLLNLKTYLEQIENIKIVLTRGWAKGDDIGEIIDIFLKNPMPLIRILGEIPIVDKVHILGTEIVLTLKDPVVS